MTFAYIGTRSSSRKRPPFVSRLFGQALIFFYVIPSEVDITPKIWYSLHVILLSNFFMLLNCAR